MLRLFCLGLAIGVVPQCSWAYFTGFEDLPPNGFYTASDTITSEGNSFKLSPAFPATCCVMVSNNQKAGSSGQELNLSSPVGLSIPLPIGANEATFLFGDYNGSKTGLVVNGVASAVGLGFVSLNQSTIGGVQVFVKPVNVNGGIQGRVTLRGALQSLVVGGTGLYLDDVAVNVPEPSTAALVVIGCVVAMVARRR